MQDSGGSDPRTGRPLKSVESLTDEELELELTVAASPPNHRGSDHYRELLEEKARREAVRETRPG